MNKQKTAIVTGIRGMDAAYLSKLLLDKDYKVIGTDRRSGGSSYWRLEELGIKNHPNLIFEYMDLLEAHNVYEVIKTHKPNELYNLAAQSFVQTSFNQPYLTTQVDYIGVLNILEAIRMYSPETKFYQASSSEMFGKVQEIPQTEKTPFYPRSPYGIAKLSAHWLTVNYRESYNIFACSGILFNHSGFLRGEEFVTRKITKKVSEIKFQLDNNFQIEPLILGNIDSKRDWGHSSDYIYAMYLMLQHIKPDDYVISSNETHTVREFIEKSFKIANINIHWEGIGIDEIGIDDNRNILVKISKEFYRKCEVDLLLGNSTKAREVLNWQPKYTFDMLIQEMVEKDIERMSSNNKLENNICIGPYTGLLLTEGNRNLFIGNQAGSNIEKECDAIIIGDNIHDLKSDQLDCIYIEDNIIIGKYLFGEENPIYNYILKNR